MTVAIVLLALAVAASVGANIWLARSRSLLFDDLQAMAERSLEFEARADDLADERDEARAAATKAEAERDEARAAFTASQAAERAARQEKADALAAIARTATADDLFALAGQLLGKALPGAPASPAASGDRGDTRPLAAVRPADAAGGDPAGPGPHG